MHTIGGLLTVLRKGQMKGYGIFLADCFSDKTATEKNGDGINARTME